MRLWHRRYQEEAYRELDSLSWWVRRKYNVLPTDQRYLDLTEGEVRLEYWLHYLTDRRELAAKNRIAVETLDDLLSGATVDEKFAKIEAELERKALEKKHREEAETLTEAERWALTEERETISHWKADEYGRSKD